MVGTLSGGIVQEKTRHPGRRTARPGWYAGSRDRTGPRSRVGFFVGDGLAAAMGPAPEPNIPLPPPGGGGRACGGERRVGMAARVERAPSFRYQEVVTKLGRPPLAHPRRHGVFVRLSDTEWGAIVQALAVEHPIGSRRPSPAEWVRDLVIAHASQVLGVDVTRAGLRHAPGGVADWKRWRLAQAVRRAAPRRRRRSGR